MKNKWLIIFFLVIGGLGILWGSLRLNERVSLGLYNQTQSDLAWQWACNSEPKSEPSMVKANSNVEVALYPSCEGELGIFFSEKENSHYEGLIDYFPTGKPETVQVNFSAFNLIEVKVKK